MPGTRSSDPHRPLLGSALVQGLTLARLLGRVWLARDQTALRARHPRDLVVRSRKGSEHRSVSRANRLRGGANRLVALCPAQFPQALPKSVDASLSFWIILSIRHQHTDLS